MVARPRTSPPPPARPQLHSEPDSGFILCLGECQGVLWPPGENKPSYQHRATSPSRKELAGTLLSCPPRAPGRAWACTVKQQLGITDGWCPVTPSNGLHPFHLLRSFATGQKQAVSFAAWMLERNRSDRKSQTRGKFSVFWVKCGGGSRGTSQGTGRGKPFPEEQPRRSRLYKASGGSQRFDSDAEGQNPRDDQELVPQNLQGLPQKALRGRVDHNSPCRSGAVPMARGTSSRHLPLPHR